MRLALGTTATGDHTHDPFASSSRMQQLNRLNCSIGNHSIYHPLPGLPSACGVVPRGPPANQHHQRVQRQHVVSRAEPDQQESESDLQKKFFSSPAEQRRQQPGPSSSSDQQKQQNIIDNVNPYELGRQARRAFDDVWGQISSLTTPTKSYVFDDILDPSLSLEEEGNESDTTVLVVGATGRVGRILIRKLLLRGYKVKALIRLREGIRESKEDIQGLPSAVEVVAGDVGELRHCQKALKGVDKVCAAGVVRQAGGGNWAQRHQLARTECRRSVRPDRTFAVRKRFLPVFPGSFLSWLSQTLYCAHRINNTHQHAGHAA